MSLTIFKVTHLGIALLAITIATAQGVKAQDYTGYTMNGPVAATFIPFPNSCTSRIPPTFVGTYDFVGGPLTRLSAGNWKPMTTTVGSGAAVDTVTLTTQGIYTEQISGAIANQAVSNTLTIDLEVGAFSYSYHNTHFSVLALCRIDYSETATVTLVGPSFVKITTTSLPEITSGNPYSEKLTATGGTPQYTWSVAGLPSGLALNGDTITKTGTVVQGRYNLQLNVIDSTGAQADPVSVTLDVGGVCHVPATVGFPLSIDLATMPTCTGYSGLIPASCSLVKGSIPFAPGVSTFGGGGACGISGTPTQAGTFTGTTIQFPTGYEFDVVFDVQSAKVPYYSQANKAWGGNLYDDSDTTMALKGCAVSSLAMAITAAGASDGISIDPGQLNAFMSEHSDFYNHNVIWGKTISDLADPNETELNPTHKEFTWTPVSAATPSVLAAALDGTTAPIIVAVSSVSQSTCKTGLTYVLQENAANAVPTGGHFVIVTGKTRNADGTYDFTINDPGCVTNTNLNAYPYFDARGYVDDPRDLSAFYGSVGDNAELKVIDSLGRQTGYDAATENDSIVIPKSYYYRDVITDVDTGLNPTGVTHQLGIKAPTQGEYVIVVQGIKAGSYSLSLSTYSTNGQQQSQSIVTGYVKPGSSITYVVGLNSQNSASVTQLIGDLNGDGKVDCSDVAIVQNSLGKQLGQTGFDQRADVNMDSIVNQQDLLLTTQHLPASAICASTQSQVIVTLASTQLIFSGATNVVVAVAGTPIATGTVDIFDGASKLTTATLQGDGKAYWYISPGLSAGTHQISASYKGDSKHPAGQSAPVAVTVNPVAVNFGVACWSAAPTTFQCTVNVSSSAGSPIGSINYTLDSNAPASLPLSNGNAQFLLKPGAGSHTVKIQYPAQGNFAASSVNTQNFATK